MLVLVLDCTIRKLVEIIAKVIGFAGDIKFDTTKPDGAPRKLMNVDRLKSLAYQWFVDKRKGKITNVD